MSILAKHLAFVNEQATFHEKMVERFADKSFRANLHKGTAEKFRALIADLESANSALDEPTITKPIIAGPIKGMIQLSLNIEELEGLPDALLQELSLSDADKTEFAIINAIEEAGGIISLDRLLIALYKKTGEVHKRNSLISRLNRMATKNSIYYVPGKKGAYSTEQLSADDVTKILGVAKQDT
jgi:hypothetical protein